MPSINKSLTFGLELEIVKLTDEARSLIAAHSFTQRYDRTIRGHNGETLPETVEAGGGTEVITSPFTVGVAMAQEGDNLVIDYRGAETVVRALAQCAREVNASCGLHVHVGRPSESDPIGVFGVKPSRWDPEKQRTWLAVCALLEDKFFDVCPVSRKDNQYCKPIKEAFNVAELAAYYPVGQTREVVARKYGNPKRYCWLNLIETVRNGTDSHIGRGSGPSTGTVEIRMLGNVRRFNYIWSWVQLWVKIGAYIAYLPSALAINRIVLGNGVLPELTALATIKAEGATKSKSKNEKSSTWGSPAEEIHIADTYARDER